jgi:3-dehydroquinate synthetase
MVGDLAGFVAGTYVRGSSSGADERGDGRRLDGGKMAVNTAMRRTSSGCSTSRAPYRRRGVAEDAKVARARGGPGEVIKHAFILSRSSGDPEEPG